MREGNTETQKQYTALVWTSRILKDEDLQCISSIKDMHILQSTPIRVLHRRSPLEREKIIHWMRVERTVGSREDCWESRGLLGVERTVGSSQYFQMLEHMSRNLFKGILDAPNLALDQFLVLEQRYCDLI